MFQNNAPSLYKPIKGIATGAGLSHVRLKVCKRETDRSVMLSSTSSHSFPDKQPTPHSQPAISFSPLHQLSFRSPVMPLHTRSCYSSCSHTSYLPYRLEPAQLLPIFPLPSVYTCIALVSQLLFAGLLSVNILVIQHYLVCCYLLFWPSLVFGFSSLPFPL